MERCTARGGRDSIDHAPGSHDDLANVGLGFAATTALREEPLSAWVLGDDDKPAKADDEFSAEMARERRRAGFPAKGGLVVFTLTTREHGRYSRTLDELDDREARVLHRNGKLRPSDVGALRVRGIDVEAPQ